MFSEEVVVEEEPADEPIVPVEEPKTGEDQN